MGPPTQPDRILYAKIAGITSHHARGGRPLTPDEEAAALAELTDVAAGRGDLLAERAGIALGFGQHQPDDAAYRLIADLCIKAGADETLIPRWEEAGRRRAETASAIPYSG